MNDKAGQKKRHPSEEKDNCHFPHHTNAASEKNYFLFLQIIPHFINFIIITNALGVRAVFIRA
jgi:hypothetical protein